MFGPVSIYTFFKDFGPLIAGMAAASLALLTYWRNAKTYEAELLLKLHNSFFIDEKEKYRDVRQILDGDGPDWVERRSRMIESEPENLTDFLNFFETNAYFEGKELLSRKDVKALFEYYLRKLRQRLEIDAYIRDPKNGFENLNRLLDKMRK